MITGRVLALPRRRRSTSNPSGPGSPMSSSSRSKPPLNAASRAVSPSPTICTPKPAALRPFSTKDAMRCSSSATRMRGIPHVPPGRVRGTRRLVGRTASPARSARMTERLRASAGRCPGSPPTWCVAPRGRRGPRRRADSRRRPVRRALRRSPRRSRGRARSRRLRARPGRARNGRRPSRVAPSGSPGRGRAPRTRRCPRRR